MALVAASISGCAGGGRNADLPALSNAPAASAASPLNASFPQSKSPASIPAAPMPRTAILPASAMSGVPRSMRPASVGALHWSQLPGAAVSAVVSPDGSLWALSDRPAGTNKAIWHYAKGTWTNISGSASSIAVGPTGTLYGINGSTAGVYVYTGTGWTTLGGGARALATGSDGALYAISDVRLANGNSAIWKYAGGVWKQQPGAGAQLASSFDAATYVVAGTGTVSPGGYYVLSATGGISYYSPGVGYVTFPGTASGLAPVPGGYFALTDPASAGGETLSYFDFASATTTAEPGAGIGIAAGPGSGGAGTQLVGVNAANAIWTTPVQTVAFNDYTTFGYDDQRDAYNPNSTAITPASLANLHLAWQAALGGGSDFSTQTQPILATGITGHNGLLFVGGGSGNVYAYDATSGALVWTRNLGQETYNCGANYTGILGIGGSAAYDPATRSLYIVGNANTTPGAYAQNTLYHLDAATGAVLGSVVFTPKPANANELDFGHTSVTLAGGVAYVGTGSFCDISSWRGRVAAIDVPSMTLANTFFTVWDPQNARGQGAQPWGGGGVWGWGGVSTDFSGNVLTAVGNGDVGGNFGAIAPPFVPMPLEYSGYAESLLELSGNLATVVADNHPVPQAVYAYANDIDLQGTPVVFAPPGCAPMAAVQGKSGELTLYNENAIGSGPIAQYQMGPSTATDYFIGDPAYSAATGLVYSDVAASAAPSLFAPGLIAISPGCGHPSVAWQAAFGSSADAPRSVPAASAGGVVFAGAGTSVWALDAATGAVLNGGLPFLKTGGSMRMPVTIDGNWIFIIDNNGNLYGLTTDSRFPAIQAKVRSATARQRMTWREHPR